MTTEEERALDQAFAAMTAEAVVPSEGLMDRIMLDADQVLANIAPDANAIPHTRPEVQGLGGALLDAIGGWLSFGGLTASAMTGLWIGVFPPDVLYDFSPGVWGGTIEVPLLESDVFAGLDG